jgi:hypothetical protein
MCTPQSIPGRATGVTAALFALFLVAGLRPAAHAAEPAAATTPAAAPAPAPAPTGVPAGPVKIPAADILDGKAYRAPGVEKGAEKGVPFLDRRLGKSTDGTLEAGIYQSAATHESYESYPSDEFMFFITGHLTLTGADGHVLKAGPQEGVFIPRGWRGRWDSTAYRKYYVVYTPSGH